MYGNGILEILVETLASGFTCEMLKLINDKKDDETITVKEVKDIYSKKQYEYLDYTLEQLKNAIEKSEKGE